MKVESLAADRERSRGSEHALLLPLAVGERSARRRSCNCHLLRQGKDCCFRIRRPSQDRRRAELLRRGMKVVEEHQRVERAPRKRGRRAGWACPIASAWCRCLRRSTRCIACSRLLSSLRERGAVEESVHVSFVSRDCELEDAGGREEAYWRGSEFRHGRFDGRRDGEVVRF